MYIYLLSTDEYLKSAILVFLGNNGIKSPNLHHAGANPERGSAASLLLGSRQSAHNTSCSWRLEKTAILKHTSVYTAI